jgi:hypothetical protein
VLSPRLKYAFLVGQADACTTHGLKRAAEEIRLQIPRRKFHGLDAALAGDSNRNHKKADAGAAPPLEPQAGPDAPVERFTEILRALPIPQPPGAQAGKDPLDRGTLWSGPSSLNDGDALASASGGIV